jgi:uncharacterized protein YyaL (SSP411 family)
MPNRLASETSPYLLQHADNPVDWYPWGEEALALARSSGRPILLSIGYSACHWCHVMAHESFEDPQTAALMNRHFVNIKVDREERPDIDHIYQTAHQLLQERRGGWPLTMFLTPDGKPFFGGTYFPKTPRYRLPGFDQLLQRVADLWAEEPDTLVGHGEAVVRHLADTMPVRGDIGNDAATLERMGLEAGAGLRELLMKAFDGIDGGFGAAPKFPQPPTLGALLTLAVDAGGAGGAATAVAASRAAASAATSSTAGAAAAEAVLFTLRRMADGGLQDHLGGGFCRYSTDAQWAIPHFEKMLYDNGPLLKLYAQAWQLTGDPFFRSVCEQTAGWVMREMQAGSGGYFSSIDADSEGEEGRFYVWQKDEVAAHLDETGFAVFAHYYGLDRPANFEGRSWHLCVSGSLPEAAQRAGVDIAEAEAALTRARKRLFEVRERRVRPGRDDKILTSWNALAIEGMAFAGRALGHPEWVASARHAMTFVRTTLWRDGRLLATHKDGRSHLNAYLDDHAFLLAAQLELMQSDSLSADELQFATALADALLEHFEDPENGGFYFTSHHHESMIVRSKTGHDGATASGNGTAALHLQRLGHMVGDERYLHAARRTMELFAPDVEQAPAAFPSLILAMTEFAQPPSLAIVSGTTPETAAWHAELSRHYLPHASILRVDNGAGLPDMLNRPVADAPRVWVCHGTHCLPSLDSAAQAAAELGSSRT